MVQAALYQLVLDRRCGEYVLPEGAALIACGNREGDRGVVHRMPTPARLALRASRSARRCRRLVRLGGPGTASPRRCCSSSRCAPELLHDFDPRSEEKAFPCPRTWEFVSHVVRSRAGLDPGAERAVVVGTVGQGAAVEFLAFLNVWRELPHPRAVFDDPEHAPVPENASALIALCGALYRLADDVNFPAVVAVTPGGCGASSGTSSSARAPAATPALQHTEAYIRWQAPPQPLSLPTQGDSMMDLTRDAMLVTLRIHHWSGKRYDRKASEHVAHHHDADTDAGATPSGCCRRPRSPH